MAVVPRVLAEVLALPTAPFVEQAVADHVRAFCARWPTIRVTADRWGNLLAHYRHKPPRTTPLVFTAHMDHPGFCALRMTDRRTLLAAFRGWVEPEYFENAGVRFFDEGRWVRGRIARVTRVARVYRMIGRSARPEEVEIRLSRPVAAQSPGMWDLPEASLRGGIVSARGCDDLAGCASMLALLERLARRRVAAEVRCLFTRAEEVGFVGAIGAARAGTIPRRLPVIAIETSKALPNAPIGAGPVLRVGDKSSIFDPGLTAFCDRVAADLARRRSSFAYQRKLMDGGTCESTAYAVYGYTTTGVCVPLGNYHNMDTQRRRIASEQISLRDWERMVDWFEALVRDGQGFDRRASGRAVRRQIDERFEKYLPLLRASSPAAGRRGKGSAAG